jgi:thiosulfate reductase cytochrome b subunit
MNLKDFEILAKKILVGVIIYLVPLTILAGGLLLINQVLK